jgi:hypothetical protein
MSNWHPLTWLSHMTDVEMFGLDPRGHHLTNVFFHAASTLLLFFLLAQITGAPWQSLFVAALFALHPLHVESVAWVAERKDVLSGFFWFLTLLLYARYVTRGGTTRYLLALLSFAAGLMAKPMLVTLPVVMLLLDGWPLKRFTWGEAGESATPKSSLAALVKEKIPFFLLATLSSAATIYAQGTGGAISAFDRVPIGLRVENSAVACVKYIGKMFWPADLAMLYPFPGSIPLWQVSGAFLLMAVTTLAVIRFRRRHPYLVTGWFWFLVTLVPVIGIIQVGGQSMADRYTYIPLTGLFIVCAWGGNDILQGWRYRKAILSTLAGLVIAISAISTWGQVGYWRDDITLYRRTLEVTTGNSTIRNNYAGALAERGYTDAAIGEYREVLRIWPYFTRAHNNLGYLLAARGNSAEAIYHHNEVLRLTSDASPSHGNPGRTFDRAAAHLNLGNVYLAQGKEREAVQEYRATLELRPEDDKAHNNLGIAYATNGKFTEAITEFNQALQLNPYNVDAKKNLAISIRKAAALGNK